MTKAKTLAKARIPTDLVQIEKDIRSHMAGGRHSLKALAEHQLTIGRLLHQAKEAVGHGGFGAWAKEKFGYTAQHTSYLMRVADQWEKVRPQIEDGSSVSKAMKALTAGKVSTGGYNVASDPATQEHPDLRQPDALTALQRAVNANQHFSELFSTDELVEAAKRQVTSLGPEKLNDLVEAATEQRDFWESLVLGLRVLLAKPDAARQPYSQRNAARVAH
jgi:hypothetical protein